MSTTTTGVGVLAPSNIPKGCEVILVLTAAAAAAPSGGSGLDCGRAPRRMAHCKQ